MSEPVLPDAARSAFEAIIRLLPRLTPDQRRALAAKLKEMETDDRHAAPPDVSGIDVSSLIG